MYSNLIKASKYLLPLLLAFRITSCTEKLEYTAAESKLEKITNNKSLTKNPYNNDSYLIDFENKTVVQMDKVEDDLYKIIGGK